MKLRKILSVILCAVMLCSAAVLPAKAAEIEEKPTGAAAVQASGDTHTYGDYEYTGNRDDTVTITKYKGIDTEVTIPGTIDGKSVTNIGNWTFSGCTSLTSITIPDSVTNIGIWAFYDCTSLISVTIPNSVRRIGEHAFNGCSSLTNITIPDSVTSIGEGTFCKCTSLTSITIPDSMTSIGYMAFYNCTSLTDVYYTGTEEQWKGITIGSDNDYLKNATIHYNSGQPADTDTTTVNKYTVTWKNYDGSVLETDNNVEYGTIPTYDGATPTKEKTAQYTYTFGGWDKAITAVTEDVTYTAEFTRTLNTYTVKWKDFDGTVLETDNNVEYGTLPTYDGEIPTRPADGQNTYTFKGWDMEITAVNRDVTYTAQYETTSVDTSTDTSTDTTTEPPATNPDDFDYDIDDEGNYYITRYLGSDTIITIPRKIKGKPVTAIVQKMTTKNDDYSSIKRIIIPDSITAIGSSAFSNYTGLESITIPNSVTSIGSSAFYNCTNLKTIGIPDSVTEIGASALSHCTSLESITIPNSVKKIDMSAFYQCESLKNITLPDGLTAIENNTFKGCTNLESLTVPASVIKIGSGVFDVCKNLTDVYYGGNEARWNSIDNKSDSGFLKLANIHFNPDDDFSISDKPSTPEQSQNLLGDVNNDGKVTAKDSMLIQRYAVKLVKLSDDQLKAADVNSDGKVTSKDALEILRYTVNLKGKYPIGELIEA